MQTLPFSEARAQLAEVLRSVEAGGEPLAISRRGQASGVLMSFAQYQQISGEGAGFSDQLRHWRSNFLGAAQGAKDDDVFKGLRQTDAEREFSW